MTGLKWWDRLQQAEAKIVARVRATIGVISLNGLAFSDQVAATLQHPDWAQRIKEVSIICIGISFLLRAGDKNDAEQK